MMDKESYDRIYKDNYKLSIKLAFDVIKDINLAEDICQDVFIKLYQNFEVADENLIRAWIAINTKRKAIDYYRKIQSAREVCGVEESIAFRESSYGVPDACVKDMSYAEFRRDIFTKLKKKNPEWHDIMLRVIILKEDPEAVARDYEMTVAHLRTKIHRARVWIRKEFGEEYDKFR